MPVSVKCFIFSMIGALVFGVCGFLFPITVLISTFFGIMAAISLCIYLFQKINTKHHFIVSGLSLLISACFMSVMYAFSCSINNRLDVINFPEKLNHNICYYGMTFCFVGAVACFLIYGYDIFITAALKFTKNHNIVMVKLFRFAFYCGFAFGCIGVLPIIREITAISKLLVILLSFLVMGLVFALMFGYTEKNFASKFFSSNIACLILSITLYYYFNMFHSNDLQIMVDLDGITEYACVVFIVLTILALFVLMIIEIVTPSASFMDFFSPLLYAAIGTIVSGGLRYFGSTLPFIPDIMNMFLYIALIAFVIGSAVSIMSIAFKMIFTGIKTSDVSKIDIDIDDEMKR